jgi:hypothetical protein
LVESFQPWSGIYRWLLKGVNGFSRFEDNGFITFLGVNSPLLIEHFNPYPFEGFRVAHLAWQKIAIYGARGHNLLNGFNF